MLKRAQAPPGLKQLALPFLLPGFNGHLVFTVLSPPKGSVADSRAPKPSLAPALFNPPLPWPSPQAVQAGEAQGCSSASGEQNQPRVQLGITSSPMVLSLKGLGGPVFQGMATTWLSAGPWLSTTGHTSPPCCRT